MAIITLNNRATNRSDTASAGQVFTATSATAADFQAGGGTNTPAFEAELSANQSVSNNTWTKVAFNTEIFDTDSSYNNSTYRFQPQTAGKYMLYTVITHGFNNNTGMSGRVQRYKNGSTMRRTSQLNVYNDAEFTSTAITLSLVVDLNGSSDYMEIFALGEGTNPVFRGDGTVGSSVFGAYKIIT